MMDKSNSDLHADELNPLKHLTRAQFAALGGDAVAYIKAVPGALLTTLIEEGHFDAAGEYHLVMSADGTPLMVADTTEAVAEWLSDQRIGVATLH
ncbi:DUF1150 family protein [Devosia sp. MC532]|uniref:DUF1150 family protein n=1 Tax=Devosia sp. MC532 TaxID=2799788 RepID=UPI0018F39A98|nr:DUF1150 family protein [Devosia sp. MC532]MBJ7577315.1 DUF1150 family protein [Devosia sp. MC532]